MSKLELPKRMVPHFDKSLKYEYLGLKLPDGTISHYVQGVFLIDGPNSPRMAHGPFDDKDKALEFISERTVVDLGAYRQRRARG